MLFEHNLKGIARYMSRRTGNPVKQRRMKSRRVQGSNFQKYSPIQKILGNKNLD